MKFGVVLPNFGPFGDPYEISELAKDAEQSGWDGFFLWDHIHREKTRCGPMVDPWIALTAVAMATSKLRIGTMITPLARRRPWKVARETVTLDRLSGGRLTLGVGLGLRGGDEFGRFGEPAEDRERALALDEGLDVLMGLWTGSPFSYDGRVYRVDDACFQPQPLQQPRIPIWAGGWWPNKRPFRRAARLDGVAPELRGGGTPGPAEISELSTYVSEHRPTGDPFDIVINGYKGRRAPLDELVAAGATWWLERFDNPDLFELDAARERIRSGPA